MKNVLIYGLQRSGTNFLESLLVKNFKIKILNNKEERSHPLHKHFRLYDEKNYIPEPAYQNKLKFNSFEEFEKSWKKEDPTDAIIIISKDPYSWLVSYQKWAKKCNWPEVDHHYIEEYNLFYEKWKNFSEEDNDRILFISYKNLILDTKNQVELMIQKFQFNLKPIRKIKGLKTNLKRVSQSKTFSDEKINYYREKRYLSEYNPSDISFINDNLDHNLLNELGYAIEEM